MDDENDENGVEACRYPSQVNNNEALFFFLAYHSTKSATVLPLVVVSEIRFFTLVEVSGMAVQF